MTPIAAHILYALAWLSFGFGHTLLAGTRAKAALASTLRPCYRLAYNGFAALHVGTVWLFAAWLLGGGTPYPLPDAARAGLSGVSVLGLVLLLLALRDYDLGRFVGITQVRNHRRGIDEPEDEPLHTGGFHAYVRHPLYAAAYLILWGNAQDPFGLATAVLGVGLSCPRHDVRGGPAAAALRRRLSRLPPPRAGADPVAGQGTVNGRAVR